MSLSKFLLKSLLKQPRRNKGAQGFTLLELLVAMALTFLIITPLMSLVISLMGNDRQEQVKVSSQQEIQAALDYIAQDLQQAIYVYDAAALNTGNSTVPASSGIQDQIPPYSGAVNGCDPGNCIPVLAFWKRKYFDRNDTIKDPVTNDDKTIGTEIDDSSKGSDRFLYSLVVYYLIKDPTPSPTWSKVARIGRFEVKDGILGPPNPDPNTPPSYLLNPDAGFNRFDLSISPNSVRQSLNSWTRSGSYTQKVETLVDYIDDTPSTDFTAAGLTNISLPLEDASGTTLVAPDCDAQTGLGPKGASTASRVPPDSILTTAPPPLQEQTSFYACVTPVNSQGQSVVQVSLRGNALPRLNSNPATWQIGTDNAQSQLSYRPSASVRVAVRGLLGGQGE